MFYMKKKPIAYPHELIASRRYAVIQAWRAEHPERVKAHRLVYVAKRNGTLIPQPCYCGDRKTHAHHDDYLRPLDVRWLCAKHHREADDVRRASQSPI